LTAGLAEVLADRPHGGYFVMTSANNPKFDSEKNAQLMAEDDTRNTPFLAEFQEIVLDEQHADCTRFTKVTNETTDDD
jgi:hypothetical protein